MSTAAKEKPAAGPPGGLLDVRQLPGERETARLLALLIEQVFDFAIFVVDPHGKIASWNEGAQRIKGYFPDEIIGRPYTDLFTEEDRLATKPNWVLSQAKEHGHFQEEGWRVRKDGERFWASVVVTALRDAHDEILGFAKITRDLSERRRSGEEAQRRAEKRAAGHQAEIDEQNLRRSRDRVDLLLKNVSAGRVSPSVENARAHMEARAAIEARDNFLAVASHELRTPLSGLSVSLSALVRAAKQGRLGQVPLDKLEERLVIADRQVGHLARLVDRLLDVSRLSTRALRLERENIDLVEVVRDVIGRYEDGELDRGPRIELKASGLVAGSWDRSRMDQVLTNLVGNAIKYGAGAPIMVAISSTESGYVRLTVRDEGPGIAPEHHDRIFDQFERATTSESIPGMGFGLWLVRRIVNAHGGTVTVESSPGRGATFEVILPTAPQPA